MKTEHKYLWLLAFLGLVFVVAVLGSLATQHSLDPWYRTLQKPSWTPPSTWFPIVWPLLYTMIAVSGWLVFLSPKSRERSLALTYYFLQLIANGLWSFFFFYFQQPRFGLLDIVIMIVLIGITIYKFWPLSKTASWLLGPYFVWTAYALALNTAIVLLN